MLYFIGLGLFTENDISVEGFNALSSVDVIYAEFYTACLMGGGFDKLSNKFDADIVFVNRKDVEEDNIVIKNALKKDVAFVVAGDPLMATTHTELYVEAVNHDIETRVINAASIFSAAPGLTGLQAYKFGKTTTVPFPDENFFPHSPYDAIKKNLSIDAHTLVLLDIQAHRDKYMSINEALNYLSIVESERGEGVFTSDTLVVGLAQAGSINPVVKAGSVDELLDFNFGDPLHCLIVPSNLHFIEAEALLALADAPRYLLDKFL